MSDEVIIKVIIKNIKKYRRYSGYKQCDLARLSGYSLSYIKKIESNRIKDISIKTLNKLANSLGINIKYLFLE